MQNDIIIGMIWRYAKNDYQINIMDFSEDDQKTLQAIFTKYADTGSDSGRGNKNLTIADANIDYWEN